MQNGKLRVGKARSLIKVHQKKTPIFSTPSFRFWVWCKTENAELKTLENWFSEVSEFSENSEFSTSPCQNTDRTSILGLFAANFASYQMTCPARAWPIWLMHRTVCVLPGGGVMTLHNYGYLPPEFLKSYPVSEWNFQIYTLPRSLTFFFQGFFRGNLLLCKFLLLC